MLDCGAAPGYEGEWWTCSAWTAACPGVLAALGPEVDRTKASAVGPASAVVVGTRRLAQVVWTHCEAAAATSATWRTRIHDGDLTAWRYVPELLRWLTHNPRSNDGGHPIPVVRPVEAPASGSSVYGRLPSPVPWSDRTAQDFRRAIVARGPPTHPARLKPSRSGRIVPTMGLRDL